MEPFSTSQFPNEPLSGCARLVRLGASVFVSGTTATDEYGRIVGVGNAEEQLKQALENVEIALATVGGNRSHIQATRVLVRGEAQKDAITNAHEQFFGEKVPRLTLISVGALQDPLVLVEVEADAELPR